MDFMLSDADRVLISQVREFGKKYFSKESVAQGAEIWACPMRS